MDFLKYQSAGPAGGLSSANTITAASSRLELNETHSSGIASSASSLDLSKAITVDQGSNKQLSSEDPESQRPLSRTQWLNETLNPRYFEVIAVLSCFLTGLTDSAMFANYSVFTSMQSGNTIFIALGVSSQNTHPFVWVRCLFSLLSYCTGVYLFAQLHNRLLAPKTRRVTLLMTYTIQAILVLIAATIIQVGAVRRYSPQTMAISPRQQWDSLAPICLLSLSAAGQVVAARSLGIMDVPTVVVTTMLCELWSDPRLFVKSNPGRNRRIAAFFMMLFGAIAGGWADKASKTVQAALWIAGGLKFSFIAAIAVWSADVLPSTASSADDNSNSKEQA